MRSLSLFPSPSLPPSLSPSPPDLFILYLEDIHQRTLHMDQYRAPPNFKRLLSAKLKFFTTNGKLIKVKRKYRIAHTPAFSERRRNSSMPFLEGRQGFSPKVDKDDIHILTKAQVDFELAQMRGMTAEEAAIVAARAVAEAEAALAEAEEAAREADAAEADAEAAQAFAAAAMKTLKGRSNPKTSSPLSVSTFEIELNG
uniref:Telomere repeat-binding factor 1 n=1 Tax=Vitis vinifera TaxID=29760 RepID=A5CB68_VITVI|nr:hypothetical protein VITISV_026625 [Vitis vinifera]